MTRFYYKLKGQKPIQNTILQSELSFTKLPEKSNNLAKLVHPYITKLQGLLKILTRGEMLTTIELGNTRALLIVKIFRFRFFN